MNISRISFPSDTAANGRISAACISAKTGTITLCLAKQRKNEISQEFNYFDLIEEFDLFDEDYELLSSEDAMLMFRQLRRGMSSSNVKKTCICRAETRTKCSGRRSRSARINSVERSRMEKFLNSYQR